MKMKVAAILAASGLSLFIVGAGKKTAQYVEIKPQNVMETLKVVSEAGFDVAGVSHENKTIAVVLNKDTPLSYLQKFVGNTATVKEITYEVSDKYFDPPKLEAKLRELTEQSDVSYLSQIGKSNEGRAIWGVVLTDWHATKDTKKVILVDAMHHAREVMTTEVAVDIVDYIVKNKDTAEVKRWLDKLVIWVVPMLNPDGNHRVNNGQTMWRKNGRGVDINRNYPYMWGKCNGSSGSPNSETYRGPSAASESETRVLMELARGIKPAFSLSYHTFSEIVIYPEGCRPKVARDDVVDFGKRLASKLVRDNGRGTYTPGTSWQLLYNVDGGSSEWFYGELGIPAYTIEVNGDGAGFHPPYDQYRDKTVERQRAGWKFIFDEYSK